ncbi:hypothetical protein D9757_007815 [Collybiopsis confluens]|uniref:Uncharacterized protein n=1 Tax=Collybiopsis confluens TaxID=2823264 RepID=A0A8H5HQ68_9AGAR|nr:hypothetical protein D9757_007815 [Collybiopsis confluens]
MPGTLDEELLTELAYLPHLETKEEQYRVVSVPKVRPSMLVITDVRVLSAPAGGTCKTISPFFTLYVLRVTWWNVEGVCARFQPVIRLVWEDRWMTPRARGQSQDPQSSVGPWPGIFLFPLPLSPFILESCLSSTTSGPGCTAHIPDPYSTNTIRSKLMSCSRGFPTSFRSSRITRVVEVLDRTLRQEYRLDNKDAVQDRGIPELDLTRLCAYHPSPVQCFPTESPPSEVLPYPSIPILISRSRAIHSPLILRNKLDLHSSAHPTTYPAEERVYPLPLYPLVRRYPPSLRCLASLVCSTGLDGPSFCSFQATNMTCLGAPPSMIPLQPSEISVCQRLLTPRSSSPLPPLLLPSFSSLSLFSSFLPPTSCPSSCFISTPCASSVRPSLLPRVQVGRIGAGIRRSFVGVGLPLHSHRQLLIPHPSSSLTFTNSGSVHLPILPLSISEWLPTTDAILPQDVVHAIRCLWALEPNVKKYIQAARDFQLYKFFNYVVAALNLYGLTTAVTEFLWKTPDESRTCKVFYTDLRHTAARSKWIRVFQNLITLMITVDLSKYDELGSNGMQEAVRRFDAICNSQWFSKTPIILLMTETDVLARKLAYSPLSTAKPPGIPIYARLITHLRLFSGLFRSPEWPAFLLVSTTTPPPVTTIRLREEIIMPMPGTLDEESNRVDPPTSFGNAGKAVSSGLGA